MRCLNLKIVNHFDIGQFFYKIESNFESGMLCSELRKIRQDLEV